MTTNFANSRTAHTTEVRIRQNVITVKMCRARNEMRCSLRHAAGFLRPALPSSAGLDEDSLLRRSGCSFKGLRVIEPGLPQAAVLNH